MAAMAHIEHTTKCQKIAIVGSGIIGRSYAMLFVSSGYHVSLFDIVQSQLISAIEEITHQLMNLRRQGLLRAQLSVQQQRRLLSAATGLEQCVDGAIFIMECIPERLELKKDVWASIDMMVGEDIVLASSTSCIKPSLISKHMTHRSQFLVCHPLNPPFYCPLVEVVPSSWTSEHVLCTLKTLLQEVGQDPVVIKKEIDGFVLNRIQYAISDEAWKLVNDGVATVDDVDKAITSGLGPQYAVIGPFMSAHLSAAGFSDYCAINAEAILRIQQDMGPPLKMEGFALDKIDSQVNDMIGSVNMRVRKQWRDKRLSALTKLKLDLNLKMTNANK